jgi:4,5-dihydroxyphthalate decarboxylase
VPEWVQTAGVWVRGILADDYGLDLASIEWVQAGVNDPGRVEKVLATLPSGVTIKALPDRSLSELLASGDIDAAISARPPASFLTGVAPVRRLWSDPIGVDRCWWAATGIFPIMHILAVRAEVLHDHPWVARNLLSAFEQAKRRSVERLSDITVSRLPLPWTAEHVADAVDLAGGDPFPYGIEPNRAVLDRFLRHAADQGVVTPDLTVDDLFWPTVHGDVRV